MLEIKNLHATVDGKEILKGLDLTIEPDEVHIRRVVARDAQLEEALHVEHCFIRTVPVPLDHAQARRL